MSEKPSQNEANEIPPWFDDVEIEYIAVEHLNPLLQSLLMEGMSDELGYELADRMEVWQIDSYHENLHVPSEDALGQITEALNQTLRQVLVDEYGVPIEQAELTLVRRWGLLAATRNPSCQWRKCWDHSRGSWCYYRECCPCQR